MFYKNRQSLCYVSYVYIDLVLIVLVLILKILNAMFKLRRIFLTKFC